MAQLKDTDIRRLGELSRIRLTDAEVDSLKTDIADIVEYVSTVQEIAGDVGQTKHPGARYNVLREDVVTNQPEQYTDAFLAGAPHTQDRYLRVKKILNHD